MRKFFITYLPSSLLLVFLAMILWTCGGGGGDGDSLPTPTSGIPVTATFSLPETVNGIGWICIDNDLDGDNGTIRLMETAYGPANSVTLTFQDVPAGTYYIYGCFHVGATQPGPPRVGDYYAIWDWDGIAGNEPGNPNAEVPSTGSVTFYLYPIEVLPPPVDEPPGVSTSAASSISSSGATLNGSVNPNGLATNAWFEWDTDSTLSNFSTTASQQAGSGTTSLAIDQALTGLSQGTTYYFRVAASNSEGESKGTIRSFTTTKILDPPTVSTLAASSITSSGATLNGNVNPNGLATDAWFEYGTNSSSLTSSTPIRDAGAGTSSVAISDQITGLNTCTQYFYRIAASNSAGDAGGDIRNLTTDCPTQCVDISGNWNIVETPHYSVTCTGPSRFEYSTAVTQNNCSVTFGFFPSGSWTGSINESTVLLSGTQYAGDIWSYSSIHLTVSPDRSSMSGIGSWSILNIPLCSGTSSFSITRQ